MSTRVSIAVAYHSGYGHTARQAAAVAAGADATRGAEQAVRDRVKHVFDEQVAMLADALRAAESEGSIAPGRATPATARAVLAQLEGMVLFAKLGDDTGVLAELWPRIAVLLGTDITEDS
jgi:hypothetical protein